MSFYLRRGGGTASASSPPPPLPVSDPDASVPLPRNGQPAQVDRPMMGAAKNDKIRCRVAPAIRTRPEMMDVQPQSIAAPGHLATPARPV